MSASKNSKPIYFYLLLALYSTILFASVLYTETYVEPKFLEGLSEDQKEKYDHRHPPYPWGVAVFLLCIPTFLLIYFAPNIYERGKKRFPKISDHALVESSIVYCGYTGLGVSPRHGTFIRMLQISIVWYSDFQICAHTGDSLDGLEHICPMSGADPSLLVGADPSLLVLCIYYDR
jgi:hypothetical protein